jgi:hypothetical protein
MARAAVEHASGETNPSMIACSVPRVPSAGHAERTGTKYAVIHMADSAMKLEETADG